jgi:hypothetical protein
MGTTQRTKPNGFLAVAACANSIKSPPRDPRDPPYHSWRGLVHTNHNRCSESRNGCIQRVSGPTSDPEIRHVALAAVPAANLGPGTRPEPAPTTHGGYGRNTTGGWLADDPQGVPPRPPACGGVVLGLVYRSPVLFFLAAPCHDGAAHWPIARENGNRTSQSRGARNQDVKNQPTSKARLPVCDFQFAC